MLHGVFREPRLRTFMHGIGSNATFHRQLQNKSTTIELADRSHRNASQTPGESVRNLQPPVSLGQGVRRIGPR